MITAMAGDFAAWRETARQLLAAAMPPDQIIWQDTDAAQPNLFDEVRSLRPVNTVLHIAADVMTLMTRIACHRDAERWALLYRALWRLQQGEWQLMQMATDPLIHRLRQMDNEIRRDAHKTKAFVRFRQVGIGDEEQYIAWHRPDHRVLPLVAPFFQRRFSVMRWSILTPDASVAWDGGQLQFGPGVAAGTVSADSTEELWLAYYSATFNPARIKVKMMKQEMPVRHWATLPEAKLIPHLLADAPRRVDAMLAASEGSQTTAAAYLPAVRTYDALRQAATVCQGCALHCTATQTVFGAGPVDAPIMLVGEQPGEQEDLAGQPFIGPAGQVLDDVLHSSGLDRDTLYITNAVKHFKFQRRGKQRIHQSPASREINACKPWLMAEIALVKPRVILTLGGTAARSLIHHGFSLKHDGGRPHAVDGISILPTWHPSAVLRAPRQDMKDEIIHHIGQALTAARHMANMYKETA